MKLIESRANPLFKQLFKWQSAAGRRGEPVLLEGIHLSQAWLATKGLPRYAIFDQDRIESSVIRSLKQDIPDQSCIVMPGSLLRSLSDVDSSQGVLFVVESIQQPLPKQINETVVLLDRLQDPGNVGTLLRTCVAAGIKKVFASTGTAACWSPKVLRSGQGAHFALELHEHVNLFELVKSIDCPLAVTTLENGTDIFAAKLPPKCAWVFGHEGQGVHPDLIGQADLKLHINHEVGAIESLNVTVAAAICLFEQRRQWLYG